MIIYSNDKAAKYREYLKGKNADVLGAGISNAPLIDFLTSAGAKVTVHDKKPKNELALDVAKLEESGVKFVCGDDYLDTIDGDIVFRTPGIRCDLGTIPEAVKRGAVITSEMEAFLSLCPCRILVITGSDGKSTTSTLTAKLLEESGYRVFLGGNIGRPLLGRTDEITPDDFVVLELSSFQLHTINRFENKGLPFARLTFPDGAVVTNVTPNHLNWHTDMEEYVESKAAVFKYMPNGARFVTNADYPITAEFAERAKNADKETVLFSSKKILENGFFIENGAIVRRDGATEREVIKLGDILLPGIHNAENYMAAIALTEKYAKPEAVTKIAKTFGGVEHRLELCRVKDGVRFYNSSIDSSPSRTLAALSTFPEKTEDKAVVLVMGGADKHIPFDILGDEVIRKARAVFISGPTTDAIVKAITGAESYRDGCIEINRCASFDEAVLSAAKAAKNGDAVLLSPACTSFDAFKNFEERGKRFKKLVAEL